MKTKVCFLILVCFLGAVICFGGSYNPENVSISINYNGENVVWSDEKCGSEVIDYQFDMQKNGKRKNHKDRARLLDKVVSIGFSYEDACAYVFPGLKQQIDNMVEKINKKAVDATLTFNPNRKQKFMYKNEEQGMFVDKNEIYVQIAQKLHNSNNITINLKPKTIKPKITKKDLENRTKLVSFFETDYSSSGENRKSNICVALNSFNGLVLKPHKTYSFNEITGRRTKEKGYKEANIIINNEYVEGFGGGVCQVSTTLYNALLLADVNVLESHSHSLESSYIMAGFDAMVNYGSSDLKFENNMDYPLYVRTYHNEKKIGVEIYGKLLPYKIERKMSVLSETKLDDVIVEDKTKVVGEKQYKVFPKVGKRVKSYLEYTKNGKLVKTKPLRVQSYNPVQGVLIVGTKQIGEDVNNKTFSSFINKD